MKIGMKRWIVSVGMLAAMGIQALAAPIGEIKDLGFYASFADVPDSAWYADAVKHAYAYGLMNGKDRSRFAPNDYLTLGEGIALAVKTYCRYYGVDTPQQQGDYWWSPYFEYAKAVGIVGSESERMTAQEMDWHVHRVYFAHIMSRAILRTEFQPINTIESLPDVLESDEWGNNVYLLYRAGVLSGDDAAGTFRPDDVIVRAEVAAVLARVVDPTLRIQKNLDKQGNQKRDIADYIGSWSYTSLANEDAPELTTEYFIEIFERDGSYYLDFTYTWHELGSMRDGKILSTKEYSSHLTSPITLSASNGVSDVYLGACEYENDFELVLKDNAIQVYNFLNIDYSMEPEINYLFALEDQFELVRA